MLPGFPHRNPLLWLLLGLCLSSQVRLAGAAPSLQAELGDSGLKNLTLNGSQLLADGSLTVEKVVLLEANGAQREGATVPREVHREGNRFVRRYAWGEVSSTYDLRPDRVNLQLQIENTSSIIVEGLQLKVLELELPQAPQGWVENYVYASTALGAPGVNIADFGSGSLAVVNESFDRPLLTGFPGRKSLTRRPVMVLAGSIGWFGPNFDGQLKRPIYPGSRDNYSVSLRFGSGGSSAQSLAGDTLVRFAATHPFNLQWPNRRPIGALHLSTSEATHHSANNPRGWFNDPQGVDVMSEVGRTKFRERLMTYADESIRILKDANAQGMIVWDLEGQEYPHATSYLGDPRSLPAEMEPVADEFFARFKAANLKVGICIRPQLPVRGAYGTPVRQIDVADPGANLIAKIDYAKKRWGASIFYVDSNGDPNFPMPAAMFQRIAAAHPDVLLIPEHETTGYWANTAPYHELRLGVTGTPKVPRAMYPNSFSVVYIPDGPVEEKKQELIAAVKAGDILLFRGWFPDSFNARVKEIYAAAGK